MYLKRWGSTTNLRTKTVDFRGFNSSIILIYRGGILRPKGNFPENVCQRILAGRLGVFRSRTPRGALLNQGTCRCSFWAPPRPVKDTAYITRNIYIYIYIYMYIYIYIYIRPLLPRSAQKDTDAASHWEKRFKWVTLEGAKTESSRNFCSTQTEQFWLSLLLLECSRKLLF